MPVIAPLGGDVGGVDLPDGLDGSVGDGDIELLLQNADVEPEETALLRHLLAGLHGVVDEVAQDHAEVDVGHGEVLRDSGLEAQRDALFQHQGELSVQDGVHADVAGLHQGADGVQVLLQAVQVLPGPGGLPHVQTGLEGLEVVVVVVPPAPHGAVEVLHLRDLLGQELVLIGGDAPVTPPPEGSRCQGRRPCGQQEQQGGKENDHPRLHVTPPCSSRETRGSAPPRPPG